MKARSLLITALLIAIGCSMGMAQSSDSHHDMSGMPGMDSDQHSAMEHAAGSMESRHMEMSGHMKLTALRPLRPGDRERADAIAAQARKTLEHYRDYRVALNEGFKIFLPNVPQRMYHFTNYHYGFEAAFGFNAEHPTSLLYEKDGDTYKLIGAMYTAPARVSESELDARIPLSIAQWHEHVNFCKAPEGRKAEYFGPNAKFGLRGSITTAEACEAAGGTFKPVIFGWMVHVYPFETDASQVWSVERQMDHGD